MRSRRALVALCAAVAGGAFAAAAHHPGFAGSKDDETRELQEALQDRIAVGDWIYDDVDEAFTVAKRTGKPIFLVFRCVP